MTCPFRIANQAKREAQQMDANGDDEDTSEDESDDDMFDSPQKTKEFYTRFTAYSQLPDGDVRTKGLIDLCVWIYKAAGGSLMEAVLNKELEDDTPLWKKRVIVYSIIALAKHMD